MADDLDAMREDVLAAALAAGAGEADVILLRSTALEANVRDGRLEKAERQESTEIGLRVIIGGRQACVSSGDSTAAGIDTMAARAVAMAGVAPRDPYAGLADADQLARDIDVAALQLADPSPEPAPSELEDMARSAEAAGLAVEGVRQVSSATAGYSWRMLSIGATNGFRGGYARSSFGVSATAICGEGTGMERDWAYESRIFRADLPDPSEVGRLAGERAVAMHGARRPPSGNFPVIFDERVSGSLIGHLLQAVNGAAIARGSSWLREALGAQILPKGLSVTEEPLRPRIPGSRPFDAEGLPTAMRPIVDEGVLTGWTLDLSTARKLGLTSTANATRGTSAPPSPGNSNIVLMPGSLSRDQLIAETGTGFLVTSLIGSTINPNTGDYSRGASGFWIENGQIAFPVNECTIAGNLRALLMTVTPANDARDHDMHRVPSLRVEGLTIAGG